jgi:hypothetical protein
MNAYNSQIGQDQFVSNYLNFLKSGFYLEIGAHSPVSINNTYFLENSLGWSGISIEYNHGYSSSWQQTRKNFIIFTDAFNIDYEKLLTHQNAPQKINYLSLDLDEDVKPCHEWLKIFPFDKYSFDIITIEHDFYCGRFPEHRQKQRDFLSNQDYELVYSDVTLEGHGSVEDWWVHKDLYAKNPIDKKNNILYKQAMLEWNFN